MYVRVQDKPLKVSQLPVHADLLREAVCFLDRISLTALLLTGKPCKAMVGKTPALTDGNAQERRLHLHDASLVHADGWGYDVYTVAAFFSGGSKRFHQFTSLSEAAEELARLTSCCFVDMLQISGACAGDSRTNLVDALLTTGLIRNTTVGHLRIVGRGSRAAWFDFRLSEYYRLITAAFRRVQAISFAERTWADFDPDGIVDPAELAVAQLFFEGCLRRGILSVDLSGIIFNVPWGTPASAFNLLCGAAPEKFADNARFLSLSSVPGLTAAAFFEFVDRVVEAVGRGQLAHNFEFLFLTDGNAQEFVKHPKLLSIGSCVLDGVTLWEACYVATFKDQSVFSVDYDSWPNRPTSFVVRYRRPEQKRGDESNNQEDGEAGTGDYGSSDEGVDDDDVF